MKLRDIIGELYSIYNPKIAENWDNVGLMLGSENSEINKILVCLDVTNEAVEKAVKEKVDLIISHHPFIFSGIKKITDETVLGRKILKLAENKVSVYSIHTNSDFAVNGLNDFIMDKLNLEGKTEIFGECEFDDYNCIKDVNEKVKYGTVRIKTLDKEIELKELIEKIKTNLRLDYIRYTGENRKIRKIGLVTGGGSSLLNDVKEYTDVFLTGDLKYHEALDNLEEGKIFVDIGHYESEYLFSDLIELQLSHFFDGEIIKYFGKPVFNLG